jgi:hypothetical protein
MTNAEKFKAYKFLDMKTNKILSILYRSEQLEIDEYLEFADTLKLLKEELWMEVLAND